MRSVTKLPWPALLLALAALASAGCGRELACTTEVTEGRGIFRATVSGKRSEADLRRDATRAACGELCAAGGSPKDEACVSRCAVDAASAKIGARTTCKQGSSSR